MATYTISVIHGDGIGPEVGAEGLKVLSALGAACGHRFETREYIAGGAAI
nr:3-isopropylmalate dehydrogenase [Planctomycetota bacterium]